MVMFFAWLFFSRRKWEQSPGSISEPLLSDPGMDGSPSRLNRDMTSKYHDLVDINTVNLITDEYDEVDNTDSEDSEDEVRLSGKMRLLWTFYYWLV